MEYFPSSLQAAFCCVWHVWVVVSFAEEVQGSQGKNSSEFALGPRDDRPKDLRHTSEIYIQVRLLSSVCDK